MHLSKAQSAELHLRRRAFSLVEVVVAVGIFAIAVISVVGLLAPINQSVSGVKEGDEAVRVAGIVQSELQRAGITAVAGFVNKTVYANRTGDKIREDTDPKWASDANDVPDLNGNGTIETFERNAQKFFEIKVTANPSLPFTAATDGFLAVNLEIRWPGYTAEGNQISGDAREQQSVLIVPIAITR